MANYADKMVARRVDVIRRLQKDQAFVTIRLSNDDIYFGIIAELQGDRLIFEVRDEKEPEKTHLVLFPFMDDLVCVTPAL